MQCSNVAETFINYFFKVEGKNFGVEGIRFDQNLKKISKVATQIGKLRNCHERI